MSSGVARREADGLGVGPGGELSPIGWKDGTLWLLDQRLLPTEELWREYRDPVAVAGAIKDMVVRGAPAIGVAAGFGVALAALGQRAGAAAARQAIEEACDVIRAARPTAVNLMWAVDRMRACARQAASASPAELAARLVAEAERIWREDVESCRAIGRHGAQLVPPARRADGVVTILTHCNAGALATGGYGTALGVVRAAREAGRQVRVLADETRPFLQGARLTAWELLRDGFDVTVITDNMAAHFFQKGIIDMVVVGADRIAKNGDVANKIGTYGVATLARAHEVPFFVAAPLSTVDLGTRDGSGIPIEERSPREVTHVGATQVAPDGVGVHNPSFDVTPARLVTAIITEAGVARAPYEEHLTGWLHAAAPSV
jgi:methylthioribose-1-phosphate isomerase